LQDVPFALFGFEQIPVLELHTPAIRHWSIAVQTTAVPPAQVPFWHVSPVVHAFPSLQDAPLAFSGFEQTPVVGLHMPVSWH